MGARFYISALLVSLIGQILITLGQIGLLFFLRILLRNQIAAVAVWILVFTLINAPGNYWAFAISLALSAIQLFLIMRFGLIAAVFSGFVLNALQAFPVTFDASAWYSPYGYAALLILAAIIFYAFRISLGRGQTLAPSRLDE